MFASSCKHPIIHLLSCRVFITEKPGKPLSLEIVRTLKNGVNLAWKPPASDGGAEITNYVLEHRIESGIKWVRATEDRIGLDTSYTLKKGLKEDMVYEFRVSAENKAGVGPPSDPTAPITIKEQISTSSILIVCRARFSSGTSICRQITHICSVFDNFRQ